MNDQWSEDTPPEWSRALRHEQWTARRDDAGEIVGYQLRTSCPRCHHENAIDREYDVEIITDRLTVAADLSLETVRSSPRRLIQPNIYVQCACTADHPGRPTGESGCGARASVRFTIPGGTS